MSAENLKKANAIYEKYINMSTPSTQPVPQTKKRKTQEKPQNSTNVQEQFLQSKIKSCKQRIDELKNELRAVHASVQMYESLIELVQVDECCSDDDNISELSLD